MVNFPQPIIPKKPDQNKETENSFYERKFSRNNFFIYVFVLSFSKVLSLNLFLANVSFLQGLSENIRKPVSFLTFSESIEMEYV